MQFPSGGKACSFCLFDDEIDESVHFLKACDDLFIVCTDVCMFLEGPVLVASFDI